MTDYSALLDKLRAAKGPDRGLDAELWLATTPGATRKQWSYLHEATGRTCDVDETRDSTHRLVVVPEITASVDAALVLVERELPGIGMDIELRANGVWVQLRNVVGVIEDPRATAHPPPRHPDRVGRGDEGARMMCRSVIYTPLPPGIGAPSGWEIEAACEWFGYHPGSPVSHRLVALADDVSSTRTIPPGWKWRAEYWTVLPSEAI